MKTHLYTRQERIESIQFDYSSMSKSPICACNLCGANRWITIAHRDRYGFPVKATTCSRCGLTMLNPKMTAESYTEFYMHHYRPLVSAYHGRVINAQTIQAEQVTYAHKFIEFIAPYLGNEHRNLLDVGGSTGVISLEFKKAFGLEVTVIDPAPDETAESKALGIESITGFIEDYEPGDKKFDVIAMFQTIDHLMDVKKTLQKLRLLLSEHGLLIVDIVDFRAAYLRNSSIEEAIKIDHVYSLTEETMEAYLIQNGFLWVRKEYSDDHLHVAYICIATESNVAAITSSNWVSEHLKEIRAVQNSR